MYTITSFDSVVASKKSKTKSETQVGQPANSSIIAEKLFSYDDTYLQEGIDDSLRFWNGGPAERGVSYEERWKCHSCEYREACEWRAQQGWVEPAEDMLSTRPLEVTVATGGVSPVALV